MILDDYEDEQIEQIIQAEKDKEQDEKISQLESNINRNAGDITGLKDTDDGLKEDLIEINRILHGDGANVQGLIRNTVNAMSTAAEALDRITGIGGLDARLESNQAEINSVKSDYTEADQKIRADLSEEVVTENVVADTVTVNKSLNVNGNATIDSLTVGNLIQNEINATSIETEELKSDVADLKTIYTHNITVADDSNWITSNRDLGNDKLWLVSIPKYDGNVQIVTRDDELAVTVINNTLVTFSQKGQYLFRVEFTKDSTDLYFDKSFAFKTIWYGEEIHNDVVVDTRDRTLFKSNINTLTGIITANEIQYGDNVSLSVLVVDTLPVEGSKNTIYTVKNDRSYYYDGKDYHPLTSEQFIEQMFEGLEFINHKVQYDNEPIELGYVSEYKVEIEE